MTEKRIAMIKKEAAKNTAVILSILMLSVMLLSAFYVTSEANHECSGENCPICAHIDQCESMLRSVGEGAAVLGLLAFLAVISSDASPVSCGVAALSTSITSKVRMND